ncbi:MAG: uroporphyrinogen-III synthase [Calditrichaeota bacterium]|nr:uroporphyrinogen-III synthase [Calditrichota bacterium]
MELQGRNIVITRAAKQAQGLIRNIELNGGHAWPFPTLVIKATDKTDERNLAIKQLKQYHWIIFSSENAVKYFWAAAQDDFFSAYKNKIAAVGSKTAEVLDKLGIRVDLVPKKFSAKALVEAFNGKRIKGKNILLPVSNLTGNELTDGLSSLGANVHPVEFYQTIPNPDFNSSRLKLLIERGRVHCITFFSPSSFHFMLQLMGDSFLDTLNKSGVAIAAIGPTTAKAIKESGLTVDIQPEKSTAEKMVQAIIAYFRGKDHG